MKVQGGAPGQVVDLDQAQEKRRASVAKKLGQKYSEYATRKVDASASAPSPDGERGEDELKQSLRRFVDWAASLAKHKAKNSSLSAKAVKAYLRSSDPAFESEIQKGQRISRVA